MNPPETLYGDGDMEYMKINQVYWNRDLGYLQLVMDNDKYILLIFKREFSYRLRNKYLTMRNIVNIYGSTSEIVTTGSLQPPIRDLQKFMRRVVFEYNGQIDKIASKWFMRERKRITKDVKIQG